MTRRAACFVRPMTDQGWRDCTDSYCMLRHLEQSCHSLRRLQLAACACCRLVWGLLPDRRCRRAVRFAEWRAQGRASQKEIADALEDAREAAEEADTRPASEAAQAALRTLAGPPFAEVARHVSWLLAWRRTLAIPGPVKWEQVWTASSQAAEKRLCSLLHRFFPSPSPLPGSPAWLAWECGPVVGLTRTIASGRRELLPILADALEEAGCESNEVLAHLRRPDGHAHGCWLVRLVLGEA
jgi:hypothetical protein